MRQKQSAFTLIELMITVAVIGILAAVAYPSYQEYLRKGRRADAQAFMQDVALRQEQYLIDARAYGTLANLNLSTIPSNVSTYYTVTIPTLTAGPPPSFVLQAQPTSAGGQDQDKCGTMTISSTGAKTPAGCW